MTLPADYRGDSIVDDNDVENQRIAEFQFNRHLQALGVTQFRTEPTPEHRKLCYDLCAYEEGKWTGVIEVRSVNYTSDQIDQFGGFMLDDRKLKALKKQFCHRSGVTGKIYWSKEIVFLFRCTKDDSLWAINMRQIVDGWTSWDDAPFERFRKDHGDGQAEKQGKLIPLTAMERIE